MVNLNELNKEQLKAIKITKGPLLILAGAGSGKTRVLTTKIAYLIEQNIAKPYQILAITFTNKAAKEMVGRLKKLIGKIANDLQVSTFHSFGLRIIKENYQLLGYSSNFVIMDSDDSISIIKKILKEFDLDSKLFNPNAIKSKISSAKNELILPKDYAKYAFSDFEKVVLKVYIRYEEMLKISNSVDFDDLQILPLKLFMEHPIILEKYQNKFRYIFIDEYQDTNKVQYLLSKMISKKYQNICVVGDNDQAIYSWRGANYQNILNFEKDYPNTQVILLEQNYRSTQNILKAANSVIINNKDRKDKKLWTTAEIGEQLTFYQAYDEKDEASYALQEIKQLIDKGIPKETIAILYRTNAQSRVVEEACLKENVPYRIVGNFYFYNRQEIKDLLAYLRLIHNEKDNISLLRVINTPRRGIGEKKITELINRANEKNQSIYEIIDSGKELLFKEMIESLKKIKDEITLTELIDKVLNASGLKEELIKTKTLEADIRLENLEEFKSITKSFEEREGLISLEDFLLEVSLVSDKSEYKDDYDRINLMTVHSVKGLEFDYVFIIGLEEGIFPHINSLMESSQLEEERRLCYVAITRARKKVYLINARRRMLYGRESVNPTSRFINEIDSSLIDMPNYQEKMTIKKEDYLNKTETDYVTGDLVYHETFGKGIVIEVSNTLVTVAFNQKNGVKKMIKNYKYMQKIDKE